MSPSVHGTRRARPIERAFFVSDLHLHGDDPQLVRRASRFVAHARAEGADALFLLGDIFRAWLGARSLREHGLEPFLQELRRCVAAGMRVAVVEGNHDFMLEHSLAESLRIESPGEHLDVSLGGMRVRLLHGDVFCTRDVGYHRLHAVLRSGPVRWLVRNLPVRVVTVAATALMRIADRYTQAKDPAVMDIVDEEVAATLSAGIDVVVCGHVHTARSADLSGGRLVVMADFESTGSHAVWRDGELRLVATDERFAPAPPVVVTIDGPAGSGKSAVAERLAKRLGYALLDSGALYRAVTWRALRDGVDLDAESLGTLARSLRIRLHRSGRLTVDGEEMSPVELRSDIVSALVSQVSAVPAVREALMSVQRGAARGRPGMVAEGRDMATVVFPEARLRFFLDARPEVRARRRFTQNAGEGADMEQVAAALAARDARDTTRANSPLRVATGAVRVDTSPMTLDEVVDHIEALVRADLGDVRGDDGN